MELTKKDFIYEGKAKKLYTTEDPEVLIVEYKDSLTAGNGAKKATMGGKGELNNKITSKLFEYLASKGVESHFIKQIDDNNQYVKRVQILPLEVIVRNTAAGSISQRLGIPEGTKFDEPTLEFSYKNDDYHDPLINDDHAVAMKLATREEIAQVRDMTMKLNEFLKDFFAQRGVDLIDFKVEYGKDNYGNIILADEISPDTCRFWDIETGEKLDKDRFRRDLGNIEEAYQEMLKRVEN